MALRLRKDGTLVCAAEFPEEPGDTYITDGEHYDMYVVGLVEITNNGTWAIVK